MMALVRKKLQTYFWMYPGRSPPGETGCLKFWGRSQKMFRDPFGCTLEGRGFGSSRIVSRAGLRIPPGSRLRRSRSRVGSAPPGTPFGKQFRAAESRPPQNNSGFFFPDETAMLLPSGSRAVTRRVSQENPPCPADPVRDRAPGVSFPGTLIGGTGGHSFARTGPNCPRTKLLLQKNDSPLRGKLTSGSRLKLNF